MVLLSTKGQSFLNPSVGYYGEVEQLPNIPPRMAARYQNLRPLAEGGMGVVCRADDVQLRETVILKFVLGNLTNSRSIRKRFRREAMALAGLSHVNIVHLHHVEEMDDQICLVLEDVEGKSLASTIDENFLDVQTAVGVVRQLASALRVVHGAGLVHRDIKPDNVLLGPDGQVTLIDFGLVRSFDEDRATALTATHEMVGTVAYLPPEVLAGDTATPLSDLFQLGVLLYECLTGELPYPPIAVFKFSRRESVEYVPAHSLCDAVDDRLEGLLGRLLATKPSQRFNSAAELMKALDEWQRASKDQLRRRSAGRTGSDSNQSTSGTAPSDSGTAASASASASALAAASASGAVPPVSRAASSTSGAVSAASGAASKDSRSLATAIAVSRVLPRLALVLCGLLLVSVFIITWSRKTAPSLSPQERAALLRNIENRGRQLIELQSIDEDELERFGQELERADYRRRLKVDDSGSPRGLALVSLARTAAKTGKSARALALYKRWLDLPEGERCQSTSGVSIMSEYGRVAIDSQQMGDVLAELRAVRSAGYVSSDVLQGFMAALNTHRKQLGSKQISKEEKAVSPEYLHLFTAVQQALRQVSPARFPDLLVNAIDCVVTCGGRQRDDDLESLTKIVDQRGSDDWRVWATLGEAVGMCFGPIHARLSEGSRLLEQAIRLAPSSDVRVELRCIQTIFFVRMLFNRYQNKWDSEKLSVSLDALEIFSVKDTGDLSAEITELLRLMRILSRIYVESHLGVAIDDLAASEDDFDAIELKRLAPRHRWLYYHLKGDLQLARKNIQAASAAYYRAYELSTPLQHRYISSVALNLTVQGLIRSLKVR